MESKSLLCNSILRIPAILLKHIMISTHPISRLEVANVLADGVDVACDIIALIGSVAGELPVLGVQAYNSDLDDDFIGLGSRDGD